MKFKLPIQIQCANGTEHDELLSHLDNLGFKVTDIRHEGFNEDTPFVFLREDKSSSNCRRVEQIYSYPFQTFKKLYTGFNLEENIAVYCVDESQFYRLMNWLEKLNCGYHWQCLTRGGVDPWGTIITKKPTEYIDYDRSLPYVIIYHHNRIIGRVKEAQGNHRLFSFSDFVKRYRPLLNNEEFKRIRNLNTDETFFFPEYPETLYKYCWKSPTGPTGVCKKLDNTANYYFDLDKEVVVKQAISMNFPYRYYIQEMSQEMSIDKIEEKIMEAKLIGKTNNKLHLNDRKIKDLKFREISDLGYDGLLAHLRRNGVDGEFVKANGKNYWVRDFQQQEFEIKDFKTYVLKECVGKSFAELQAMGDTGLYFLLETKGIIEDIVLGE